METRHHIKQMRRIEKYLTYWRNHLITVLNKITNRRYRMKEAKDAASDASVIIENIRSIDDLLIHHLHTERKLPPIEIEIKTFHEETRDDGIHYVDDEHAYDQWIYTPGERQPEV